MKTISIKSFFLITVLILVGLNFIYLYPFGQADLPRSNYILLLICYFFVASLLIWKIIRSDIYLFEPIVLVTALYMGIFILRPMLDISNFDTVKYGIDISDGSKKATLIFMISFLSFFISYFYNFSRRKVQILSPLYYRNVPQNKEQFVVLISLTIWLFSFICSLIFLLANGYGFLYILTIGASGSAIVDENSASLAFLSKFSICLVTSWLYIFVYSKSKLLKIILFILTVIIFLVYGGRAMLLICLLAPVTYYYVSKKKSPSLPTVFTMLIGLLSISTIMQFARWGIRSGDEIVIPKLSFETLFLPFDSEFTTYKVFYGMVKNIPTEMGYLFGEQMIYYTLVMFIPRAIWPGKPDAPVREILEVSLNQLAVISGAAYPNIGEFYVEFGILGCIIFMFLFGLYAKRLKKLYLIGESKSHALILYSVLFPLLFQFTIRGYMPSNFYTLLLAILPCIIIKKLIQVRQ